MLTKGTSRSGIRASGRTTQGYSKREGKPHTSNQLAYQNTVDLTIRKGIEIIRVHSPEQSGDTVRCRQLANLTETWYCVAKDTPNIINCVPRLARTVEEIYRYTEVHHLPRDYRTSAKGTLRGNTLIDTRLADSTYMILVSSES